MRQGARDQAACDQQRRAGDAREHKQSVPHQNASKSGVAEPEMFAGGPYRPDDPITRIELAAIIQNIIIRATGMQDIAAMYLNRRSPFSDVPTVSPCFNAVMLSATWGIMTTQVSNQEQFDPLGPESGPGMLKTLYRLKEKIEQLKAGKIDQP